MPDFFLAYFQPLKLLFSGIDVDAKSKYICLTDGMECGIAS